jgi:hypothetical protein
MTFWNASSSALSGGGSRLATSSNLSLITEVAISTGRPAYFAAASGGRSIL